MSLRFPNQASLRQRRLYVALEMTLLIIAQFSRISLVFYEETEHFKVTRDFLNRYPTMLKHLLDEPNS